MLIKKRNCKSYRRRKSCRRKTCRGKTCRRRMGGISLEPRRPLPLQATVRQPGGPSFTVNDNVDFDTVQRDILGHPANQYADQIRAGNYFIHRGPGVASLPGQPANPFDYEITRMTRRMRQRLNQISQS